MSGKADVRLVVVLQSELQALADAIDAVADIPKGAPPERTAEAWKRMALVANAAVCHLRRKARKGRAVCVVLGVELEKQP